MIEGESSGYPERTHAGEVHRPNRASKHDAGEGQPYPGVPPYPYGESSPGAGGCKDERTDGLGNGVADRNARPEREHRDEVRGPHAASEANAGAGEPELSKLWARDPSAGEKAE